MTVAVASDLVFIDQGDGVTTEFSYPVKFLEASELVVFSREDGVDTTLVLNTHYTVSGAGVDGGGTITMLYVPSAAEEIGRYRSTGAKQIVDLVDGARNPAQAVEKQLDRLAMVGQDSAERIARAVKVAPGAGPLKNIPMPEAGMPLLGNDGEDGFVWGGETYASLRDRVDATEDENATQDGRLGNLEALSARAYKAPSGQSGKIIKAGSGAYAGYDAFGNLIPLDPPGGGNMNSAFNLAEVNATLAKINLGLPASPFEGTAQVMRHPPLGNMSFCAGLAEEYSTGLSILWRFDVCAGGHVTVTEPTGGFLMAAYSRDGGVTWSGYRTIYSDGVANVAEGTRIGTMGGDRIGGILVLREGGVNVPYFIYSDDYFATPPTVVNISASITEPNPFVYFRGIPWPAADGGDDLNGFIWPFYGSAQDRALVIATDDNGATFSEIEINGPTPSGMVNEIVPVRLPDGSWMVFARSSADPGTPIYCCVASTFAGLSGSPWVDTGIVCGGNPISVLVDDDGVVHLSIIYRTLAPAAYTGQRNIQVIYSERYQTLYAGNGVFSGDPRFGHQFSTRATGQVTPYRLAGRWLTTVTVGESRLVTARPSRTQTVLISSEPRASMPVGFSTAPLPAENLLFNPYFEQANGALSGNSVATGTETADCIFSISSGDTMDFAIEDVPADIRDKAPFRPTQGLRLTVSSQDGSCGILNRIEGVDGKLLINKLSLQPHCAVGIAGYGDAIPNLQASISVDAEGDGSALTVFTETFPIPHSSNDGIWYTECEVGDSGADTGIAQIDETLVDDAKVNVAFQTSGGSTSAFDTVVLGLSMSFNDAPAWPLRKEMPQGYRGRIQRLALSNGQNDNVFVDAGFVRVAGPTAAFSITGFYAPPHITEFTLFSTVAQALTIANLNAGSAVANRIFTSAGDVTTSNLGAFRFVRDRVSTTGGWILCGKEL